MSGAERSGARGPMRRVLAPEQAERLEEVARVRRDAERAYLEAIVEAHRAGATNSAIARAVGVSEESIRKTVKRYA